MSDGTITILLIDHNGENVEVVRSLLNEPGGAFDIKYADCLETGLELARDQQVSTVLLDLPPSASDGIETLARARAHAPDVPIIVLTGLGDESLRTHALLEGAYDYLVKGHFDADILRRVIWHSIERKRTEAALQASEARFRKVVEKNADAMLVVNDQGVVRFANPAAQALFGLEAQALVGTQFGFPLTGGETTEIDVVARPRGPVTVEMRVIDLEWGNENAYLVSMRDITDRRRAEEELKQRNIALANSNRELDEFAYAVSHDLKEPLRGIRNYAEFLNEDYGSVLDQEGVAKLATLTRLADSMTRLIDSVLEYSHVGRQKLDIEPTSLNDVMDEVRESLGTALRAGNVEVRIPAPLPMVLCDRVRVGEVFQNLISNAVKYNDKPQKWVEIGCADRLSTEGGADGGAPRSGERECTLYVRDNGIGIPGKHLKRIFRIFKRLHSQDEFSGGAGIGLTMAKKIVERHGGRMWVESTLDEGTTFFFTLQVPER